MFLFAGDKGSLATSQEPEPLTRDVIDCENRAEEKGSCVAGVIFPPFRENLQIALNNGLRLLALLE